MLYEVITCMRTVEGQSIGYRGIKQSDPLEAMIGPYLIIILSSRNCGVYNEVVEHILVITSYSIHYTKLYDQSTAR